MMIISMKMELRRSKDWTEDTNLTKTVPKNQKIVSKKNVK